MHTPYHKDMSNADWARVYEHQRKRAPQVAQWLDALQLRPGEHVLDLGAGPGFVSLEAARRVGRQGLVYAVDRSAEALAYLQHLQEEQGLPQIQRIVADARTLRLPEPAPNAALITVMLHHMDDPAGALQQVASLLPAGSRAVVAEFHPDGPSTVGPPRTDRLHPDQITAWCKAAGFAITGYQRQSDEEYMLVLARGAGGQPGPDAAAPD